MNTKSSGVSLLEMMIVLTIASIIFLFATPSAQHLIAKSRITAAVNDTSALLQYARYMAVSKYKKIVICPTSNAIDCNLIDWHLPLIVFQDDNYNGKRDLDEKILRRGLHASAQVIVKGPKKRIAFQRGGSLSSPATINICLKEKTQIYNRALYVSLNGRIRLSKDTNGDSYHDNGYGKDALC